MRSLKFSSVRFVGWTLFAFGLISAVAASEFTTDFNDGIGLWEKSPSGTWEVQTVDGGNQVATLSAPGTQPGGVRRPTGYLLLPAMDWTDTTFTFRARSLEPATTINRDVVVIFGYVDETHFYYAHLSSNSDDRFHTVIMKVMGDERETIDLEDGPRAPLAGDWHDIRLTHASTGAIAVYVDDMETPVMTAQDTAYPTGRVGFGCFDDRAQFDDVRVEGAVTASRAPTSLTNLSTRARVETGGDIMIAGFVLQGSAPQEVLIRAAGPALADFRVEGAINDPLVRLYRSGDSETVVASNDNWEDVADLEALESAVSEVGAFAFSPMSADAAMLVTLEPGAYTTHVAGVADTTGVSLVEVYALP